MKRQLVIKNMNVKNPATVETPAAAVLYVDVVKNVTTAPAQPPPESPAEFCIFREDFPALPGTRGSLRDNSNVPDDWSAMISDDDEEPSQASPTPDLADREDSVATLSNSEYEEQSDDDVEDGDDDVEDDGDDDVEDDDDEFVHDDDTTVSLCSSHNLPSSSASDAESLEDLNLESEYESNNEAEQLNQTAELTVAVQPVECAVNSDDASSTNSTIAFSAVSANPVAVIVPQPPTSSTPLMHSAIFAPTFLSAGVQARARDLPLLSQLPIGGALLRIAPPPGYRNIKYYARLRTNAHNIPLGGVMFDSESQSYEDNWWKRHGYALNYNNIMHDDYGLIGLANILRGVQRFPLFMPHMFGYDAQRLNLPDSASGPDLYECFGNALGDTPTFMHEKFREGTPEYSRIDYSRLPAPLISKLPQDTLFMLFYMHPGDMLQLLAAAELVTRGWRYHKFEYFWITRNAQYLYRGFGQKEIGEFYYFNKIEWAIGTRFLILEPWHVEQTLTKTEIAYKYGPHPLLG